MNEINLDEVIKSKSPGLYRSLPRFAINYLKRLIHIDEINYCLQNYGHLTGVPFIGAILDHFSIMRKFSGGEGLKPEGRYIFASNHPLGGLDGLALAEAIDKSVGNVRIVVNDLLMNLEPIKDLFVPVNKHGAQSAEYARMLADMYESDANILYFPAGLCSRKINGVITDTPWKKNFLAKAIEYKRDVVPVYIDTLNSNRFYNIALLRKRLGVKANIEMLLLPDEMVKQKGREITIRIGKPISYQTFTEDKTLSQWVLHVRKEAYALGGFSKNEKKG